MNNPTIKLRDPPTWAFGAGLRPGTSALRDWLARHWRRLSAPAPQAHHELLELDARTLADIGAPERLQARAMARREAQRQERDGLQVGLASGAWHHW
jgi:uncharacterized protein YjiS (DUF1127 family)